MMQKQKKLLAYLLIIGLGIILIQVALGGLTRLTGSGLSMTDWNLIMGTFPPITDAQWLVEFDEYKASPQYQKLNKGMDMASFKFIYFWEYTHRVWGRFGFLFLMGILTFFGFKRGLFQIKLDISGSNEAEAPRFKDLRVRALA